MSMILVTKKHFEIPLFLLKDKRKLTKTEFGAGSKKFLGDEYIFITDLLKIGGKAVFLPITIATHPSQSSGVTSYDQATMQARAKVFNRVFGFWAPLVRALFFIKNFRKTGNLLDFLKFIVGK